MSKILDGRLLAREIEENLTRRIEKLRDCVVGVPTLVTVLVGKNPASVTYVRMKKRACERIGLVNKIFELSERTTTGELLGLIYKLNEEPSVSGILLQHPTPSHIDERACFDAIAPKKDVDGVNSASFGAMAMGLPAFKSATPFAILSLLHRFEIPIAGKHAVVIGRSAILGKPVSMLLLAENATVTICHSKTQNLPEIVKNADILVAAIGRTHFVQANWVKPGAVLVDAGYNEGNLGDIDPIAFSLSSAHTPVPGGVGPVTIAKLMEQMVQSREKNMHY